MKTIFILVLAIFITSFYSYLQSSTNKTINNNYLIYQDGERYIGEEYLDGIIFHIYTDDDGNQYGLIVSIEETTTRWQNIANELVEANDFGNGAYNMNMMRDSPAKEWIVENFSPEWYLPSIDELEMLWKNRDDINRALRAASHSLIPPNSNYWSSTESTQANAFGFYFSRMGNRFSRNKTNAYRVRAIRTF